ncbi:hypothetical protein CRG98_034426 [Punica granatum]|uniref:Uncharacterized protein n=1 Tax=Punica granatum TaxID=22663 RepID=A0A2I0IMF3_PUNGR|nr:hypothetical protein CRG98_034426 [Punica granatum]
MCAPSHRLGVTTFPWGRVTDTLEKESPLAILRPEDRVPTSYLGLRVQAMGSVELSGHVRPYLTYPIRAVFHIDTTQSETVSRGKTRFRARVARTWCEWALDP